MPAVKPEDVDTGGSDREKTVPATVKLDGERMEVGDAIRHLHDKIGEGGGPVVDSRHQDQVPVGEAVNGAERNIEQIYEVLDRQREQIEELRESVDEVAQFAADAHGQTLVSDWDHFDEGG